MCDSTCFPLLLLKQILIIAMLYYFTVTFISMYLIIKQDKLFSCDDRKTVPSFLLALTSVLPTDFKGIPLAQACNIYHIHPSSQDVLNPFSHHLFFIPDFAFNTPISCHHGTRLHWTYNFGTSLHFTCMISLKPRNKHTKWAFWFLYIRYKTKAQRVTKVSQSHTDSKY